MKGGIISEENKEKILQDVQDYYKEMSDLLLKKANQQINQEQYSIEWKMLDRRMKFQPVSVEIWGEEHSYLSDIEFGCLSGYTVTPLIAFLTGEFVSPTRDIERDLANGRTVLVKFYGEDYSREKEYLKSQKSIQRLEQDGLDFAPLKIAFETEGLSETLTLTWTEPS